MTVYLISPNRYSMLKNIEYLLKIELILGLLCSRILRNSGFTNHSNTFVHRSQELNPFVHESRQLKISVHSSWKKLLSNLHNCIISGSILNIIIFFLTGLNSERANKTMLTPLLALGVWHRCLPLTFLLFLPWPELHMCRPAPNVKLHMC